MSGAEIPTEPHAAPVEGGPPASLSRVLRGVCIVVAVWFVLSEGLTELWYRGHELRARENPSWSFRWPDTDSEGSSVRDFQEFPVSGKDILHFDRSRAAAWVDANSNRWIVTVLEWNPGAKVSAMDSRHNPMICLPSVGFKLVKELGAARMPTAVGELSFRGYEFRRGGGTSYVFSGVIRALDMPEETLRSGKMERRLTQLQKALNGNRQSPERVLLIAVEGPKSPADAERALRETLPGWVKPGGKDSNPGS